MKENRPLGFEEFVRLARKANVIPVYKEVRADLDTPVSVFLKIKKTDYSFLLESVEGQENIARYSFIGADPCLIFKSRGKNIEINYSPSARRMGLCTGYKKFNILHFTTKDDPVEELKKIMADFHPAVIKGLPRFCGGLVGCLSYDMVRFFEDVPDKNADELKLPDSVFILTDTVLAFDHVKHTIKIIANVILPKAGHASLPLLKLKGLYADALKKIEGIQRQLRQPLRDEAGGNKKAFPREKIRSNLTRNGFKDMVFRAKKYIRKGDIIQVVLSQRFHLRIHQQPFEIYRNLRSLNPSPYMFFLKLGQVTLVGSSPEMLVRCEDGVAQTRPIAGTRHRGDTEKEDKRLEKELLHDSKEKAEHIMLVDLGRNDLGRVCMPGKVKVGEFMAVERYSHVMHIVSDISGEVNPGYDSYDVLRACFPAGTVSGSPKIRAMEIIDELENTRRSLYAGCVAYFSFSRNMDTCITIRTIVIKGNTAYVQAGAGIVADSMPEKEYQETVNKAKALLEAAGN
ncbi:MAG: anthranilate synthase component I [Candidatus Omnitrophota bacterium]